MPLGVFMHHCDCGNLTHGTSCFVPIALFVHQWLCFSQVDDGMEENFEVHVINKHQLGTKLADVGEHKYIDRLLCCKSAYQFYVHI